MNTRPAIPAQPLIPIALETAPTPMLLTGGLDTLPSSGDHHTIIHFPSVSAPIALLTVASPDGDLRLAPDVGGSVPRNEACLEPDLVRALRFRGRATGAVEYFTGNPALSLSNCPAHVDDFAAEVLVLPRSERWREAVTHAINGGWCNPLIHEGCLPASTLGALRAEARTVHRQLVPLWRRRTRHGRVLSLDADLGGLSLHDLVAADINLLVHTAGGVFADERLNTILRGLAPDELAVVIAYAEGEGTTWTEAATHTGAADPEAFGERVRRKTKRLAAEQQRRRAQRREGMT